MIFTIVIGLLLLIVLIIVLRRLARAQVAAVRQMLLRIVVIFVLVAGIFISIRYWIVYSIRCNPDCIGANLIGWDLEGVTLRNSQFVEANLRGATLNAADLYNADFSGANLISVNLQNANLRNTLFIGAQLAGADFRGAVFGDTDLRGAELNEADLTRVDLTRVHLQGAVLDNAKLVEANLAGKDLAGLSLVRADLTGADLSNTNLSGSRLSGANLSGARLTGSNLSGAMLNLADLTGADLRDTAFDGANLLGATLASSDLSNSRLTGANLIGAHVNGTNLLGANLTGSRLLASELLPVDLISDPLLRELNQLQQFEVITDVDLSGVRFNRNTQWPMGRTTFLTQALGSRFLEYSLPLTSTTQAGASETMLEIMSSPGTMLLTTNIYREFIDDDGGQPMLIDSGPSAENIAKFCDAKTLHLIITNWTFPASEIDRCGIQGREVISFPVGIRALAVVVNPDNNFVSDLTKEELRGLAIAKRWSDVNLAWPREQIERFIPDLDTAPIEFWQQALFRDDIVAAAEAQSEFSSVNNSALLVQGVNNNLYAVGVIDYATYLQNTGGLKLLSIDGQLPNEQSIQENTYPLTQTLYLYADANQIRQLPNLQKFLLYYFDQLDTVIPQVGLFPVAPAIQEDVNRRLAALVPPKQ